MSAGLMLLRSLIDNGARSEFRQLDERYFVGDELPVYEFVTRFYRTHGALPSLDACAEQGHILPAAPNPPTYYVERVRNRAIFNTISTEQPRLVAAMQGRDMQAALEVLQRVTQTAHRFSSTQNVATLAETVSQVMEDYRMAHRHPGQQGITLGWDYLDELTGGAEPGDVITFAARPGMGKSWTVGHCADRAWNAGHSVLLVSMEMTGKQMGRRQLGLHARVNPDYLRRGQLSVFAEEIVVERAANVASGAPFHILSGQFDQSVPLVDAAIQEFSPDIVFIDASYLMTPSGPRGKRAQWELLTDVGKEIKQMALARNKPIIQTVQFNREAKKAKQMDLIHIGGSDAVGQISTIAIAITEGEAPNEATERRYKVMKNREGDLGEFRTRFLFDPPDFSYIPPDGDERAYDDTWRI